MQSYKFNISNVISNENVLQNYLQDLNKNIKNKTISEILTYARSICNGLPSEENISMLKNDKNIKDKGLFGKIIEYGFFGQKPNSSSGSDLINLGYDIKTCQFKTLKNNGKNAKERQTLTNCGNTNNYESFKNIYDNEQFSNCKYYEKIKKFILVVRNDDKIKLKTFEQLLNQSMMIIVLFIEETDISLLSSLSFCNKLIISSFVFLL